MVSALTLPNLTRFLRPDKAETTRSSRVVVEVVNAHIWPIKFTHTHTQLERHTRTRLRISNKPKVQTNFILKSIAKRKQN